MNNTSFYTFFDLSVLSSWLKSKVFFTKTIISHKKEQRLWAQATKDIPLSDFKLQRATEGTVVMTWPVSSVEDLESTVGTICDSNDFTTRRR